LAVHDLEAGVEQRRADGGDDVGVVVGQGHPVVGADLGLGRAAGRGRLAAADPGDRLDEAVVHAVVVGTDVDVQLRRGRDDVRLRARLQHAHGDDAELERRELARHDGLQPRHDRGRDDDRVDRVVRHRAVPTLAVHDDLEVLRARHRRPGPQVHAAGALGADVLPDDDVRPRQPVDETVLDHRDRAVAGLLGGLEERDEGARPGVPGPREQRGGAEQPGHVEVVAAGVHRRPLHAVAVEPDVGRGVGQPRRLGDRQPVHVRPEHHHRAGLAVAVVAQHPDDTGAADALGHLEAELAEPGGADRGAAVLAVRQLGMGVQVGVGALEPVETGEAGEHGVGGGRGGVRHAATVVGLLIASADEHGAAVPGPAGGATRLLRTDSLNPQEKSMSSLPTHTDVVVPAGVRGPRFRPPAGASTAESLDLNGEWRFRLFDEARTGADPADDGAGWDTIAVPGHWQLAGVPDAWPYGKPAYTNVLF